MPFPKERPYTIEDIYNLPDGERAELIDGQIYYMAPPSRKHQEAVHFLDRTIGNYIQSKRGSCKVYPAPFAVYLDEYTNTYVEPDISVICDKNKLNDRGCMGAPDWIVEIVSPSSKRMDYSVKLFKYHSAGLREYWVVDPEKNRITVHDLAGIDMNEYSFTDSVKVGIYEDFFIDFSQLDF